MEKALIVDDDRSIRLLLEEVLSESHDCSLVCNGREGFELACKEGLYDIVLMDLNMPEWNGMDALGMIQTLNPDARVIVLTGHLPEANAEALQAMSCVRRILEKPVRVSPLLSMVQEVQAEGRGLRIEPQALSAERNQTT